MSIKIYKNQIGIGIISLLFLAYLMSPISIVGFYFPFAVMCVWLVWCVVRHPHMLIKILFKEKFLLVYIYPLFLFLYYITGRTLLSKVMISFMLANVCLIFLVLSELNWKKLIANLAELIIAFLTIINFYTIFRLLINPFICRLLSQAGYWETLELIEVPFIGGFMHIYSLCMLVVCVVKLYFICDKGSVRMLYLLFIITSVITIILSHYTYALLLMVLFIGLLLLEPFFKKKYLWLLPILAIIIFLIILYREECMDLLIRLVGSSSYVGQNIINLKKFLTSGSVIIDSDAYKRKYVYMISIQTWLSHFWYGIGYSGYRGMGRDGIGGHSEIFDSLAHYGLIGTICFVLMIIFITVMVMKRIDRKFYFLYILIVLEYIVELFINQGFTLTQFTTVYFIIPSMLCTTANAERINR